MIAVGQYVLVEQERGVTRTSKSGLDIPTEMKDRFVPGKVISASKLAQEEFGITDGVTVLYDKHAGHPVRGIDGVDYKVVTVRDIAVVL